MTDAQTVFEGGPTHRLMVRVGVVRQRAPELARGALALALVAWLPLLLLSAAAGYLFRGVPIPFLFDFGAHARLLLSLPLLIVAEVVVGPRLGGAAAQFLVRKLVKPEERERFEDAVAEALRIRDSAVLEVAVLVLAYLGSFASLAIAFSAGVSTWDLLVTPTGPRLTMAGIWNTFVAIPLYQFLVYRTLVRLLAWSRFLWRVAVLDLQLVPTHPDKAAGLGFLGGAHRPIGLFPVAVSSVLSGRFCSEILYKGATLESFRIPVAIYVAVMVLVCMGPLLAFMPTLLRARRQGLGEYGTLALRYTRDFDRKWLRGGAAPDEELLGSGDIQSLADMGGSFERIVDMRPVPFSLKDVSTLVAACLLPMAPVLATAMPMEQVLATVVKVLG